LRVSAVVPTYNERENIAKLLPLLASTVPGIRVLVVDDNSPDGTGDVVRGLQTSVAGAQLLSRTSERGFGSAYIAGFRKLLSEGDAEAIVMMDADLSHHPSRIPDMIRALNDCDAVIGSRYTSGGSVEGWEWHRRLLSIAGNSYVRLVTGMPFRDSSSGFMLVRTEVLREIELDRIHCNGYAFLMEMKYRLWKRGAALREVPIRFSNRVHGESKISGRIIREGIRAPWRLKSATS
jgi:dolichol-phosphate mannosyltransferase